MQLSVQDDGRGFAPEAVAHSGMGLLSMQKRAEMIGFELHIDSNSTGTTVRMTPKTTTA